jgi:hypothetical protein
LYNIKKVLSIYFLFVLGNLFVGEKYKDLLEAVYWSRRPARWKTQRVLLWQVTFEIDKYKYFLDDLILMGDLPVSEKYKDFSEIV